MNRNIHCFNGTYKQLYAAILALILAALFLSAGHTYPVYAQSPADIPDANLKKALHEACGVPLNEKLYKEHLGELTGDLDLSGKNIASLEGIEAAIYLLGLDASNNPLKSLPADMWKMYSLMRLNLDGCQFTQIPPLVSQLEILQSLSMKNNKITDASGCNGCLYLDYLYLDGNQLTDFPSGMMLPSLSVLSLERNKLTAFPSSILTIHSLREINVNNNILQTLPAGLGDMANLTVIRADKNQLRSIPPELGRGLLEELHVSENRLTTLPAKLFDAKGLFILEAGCNRMTKLPQGIEKGHYEALTLLFNFFDFSEGSSDKTALDKVSAVNKAYLEQLTPIQGLAATSGVDDVVLAWQPCPDYESSETSGKVRQYEIYLEDKGNLIYLDAVDKEVFQYDIGGLKSDTEYLYWVGVVYDVNMPSVYSGAVTRHYTPISIRTLPPAVTEETSAETEELEEPEEPEEPSTTLSETDLTETEPTEFIEETDQANLSDPDKTGSWKWIRFVLAGIAVLALAVVLVLICILLKRRKEA